MGFGAVLTHSRLSLKHRRHVSSDGVSGSPKSHLSFLPKVNQPRAVSARDPKADGADRRRGNEGSEEGRDDGPRLAGHARPVGPPDLVLS